MKNKFDLGRFRIRIKAALSSRILALSLKSGEGASQAFRPTAMPMVAQLMRYAFRERGGDL
jgi:hypothetical protein